MKHNQLIAACALALMSSVAAAQTGTFTVKAKENSSTGGAGLATFNLMAGDTFTVSVDPNDLWNAGALPRWSNANGLTGQLYSPTLDPDFMNDPAYSSLPNETLIGGDFATWSQAGLTAHYGSLVGQIDSGAYFKIGTSYSGTAASGGTLKLFYWDSNNYDNTGSIAATVTAVPEPETYALMLAGLGLVGFMARRRAVSVS